MGLTVSCHNQTKSNASLRTISYNESKRAREARPGSRDEESDERMTILCTVIGRNRHKMIQAEIQEAARRGAQMIELRLDFLTKAPDFKRLLALKPCSLIATVRRQEDGGRWTGTEAARQMLLRQAVVAGFDWVDLELDVADIIGRFKNVKRIISYHNLREMPDDLEELYQ